ncbi:hypothetical protein SASPL_139315 [Salvia splendens]|uniref:non-specific serine/threonine protein kinase n=1 Tax=Salvia splendens TaxID=180675 RepID=A0A8X8WNR8_SALSN|nr:hypothetical protein SASPL_139315 [Salvia splendens]
MKTLLASLDLWELVDEGYDEANANLSAAQIKKLKKTKQRDAAALSKIQPAVAESIFYRIMGAEKSKEAWEILQKEFGGDEKVRAIKLQTLRRDFENTKMKDNETLNQFHLSFIELTNQMRVYGEEISDQRMMEKILICLPKRFNAIVAVIEQTKDISKMSIYELMGSLKSYEERLLRQSEKSIESAFQSKMHLNGKSVGESSFNGGQQNRSGSYGRGRGQEKTKHDGRGFHKAENGKSREKVGKYEADYSAGNFYQDKNWEFSSTGKFWDPGTYGELITPWRSDSIGREKEHLRSAYGPLISAISVVHGNLKGLDLHTGSFTLRQLRATTNNFDPANMIGEGGFGPVYKGVLLDKTIIAVKQLSSKSKQGNREFVNEIGPVKHQLDLDWPMRQKICIGRARGLAYLHEESRLKIVHRDIKTTNVFLDKNLVPKISDFGLAKLDEDETHISTRIAGTFFGVVVLEIVSGRSNGSIRPRKDKFYLLDWAIELKEKGNLLELVERRLESSFNQEEIARAINVALICTNEAKPDEGVSMDAPWSGYSTSAADLYPQTNGRREVFSGSFY